MKSTVDAVFRDGVFQPVQRPDLPEGERVRLTLETVGTASPSDMLGLATRVYVRLSAKDIEEIEEMARHRPFFTDAEP